MAENDHIIDKIKKCLALSKSDNVNEAEAALRQARKLMDKYNLEMSDVHASVASQRDISAASRSNPPAWDHRLARVCAEAFGCVFILSWTSASGQIQAIWVFVGVDPAPSLSIYAYEVLGRQLRAARRMFLESQKRCKLATRRRRADEFARAWILGVAQKIADFSGSDEAATLAIEAFKAKHYPNLTCAPVKVRKRTARDDAARVAGFKAGQKAELRHAVDTDSPERLGAPS